MTTNVIRLQDRLFELLGGKAEARARIVAGMLHRSARDASAYWLQLVVSVGIATLGLVLGSVAVIIGAMLVAPLMAPIVTLAMGLATGSPFLVLRSAGRVLMSVAVSIGGAACITLLLPFHDLNAEIASRTTPTVLDLFTAGFCAVAGVYAAVRPGSDTAATAAGTSIGISLVPPLCASGYGVGTLDWAVAGGAALLFLTNLVAIVFVGTLAFVAVGFNQADVASLERDELADGEDAPLARALARHLARVFASPGGPALRLVMPFALLAAVYLPLRRALDEVAWQVRVSAVVRAAIARHAGQAVHSRVRVDRGQVDAALIVLGKASDAEKARVGLTKDISAAVDIVPRIQVHAVPDASALAGLESDLLRAAAPKIPMPSLKQELEHSRAFLRDAVRSAWPSATLGEALAIDVGTAGESTLRVRVVHLGPALGADAREALERSLQESVGPVKLEDAFIPPHELVAVEGELAFVAQVARAAHLAATLPDVSICVSRPADAPPKQAATELATELQRILASHPRVKIQQGESWRVRFVRGVCLQPEASVKPPPADAAPDSGRPAAAKPAAADAGD